MSASIGISLASAAAFAVNALIGKMLLRYRICDAGLVTWGTAVAMGLVSLVVLAVTRPPFPIEVWPLLLALAVVLLSAGWAVTHAMQEGDPSTVAPMLGAKVPITAILAFFVLGEVHSATVYVAVVCAAGAIVCFGLGKQEKAQGSHGLGPAVPIVYACVAAAFYAVADQIAKLCLAHVTSWSLVLWSSLIGSALASLMLTRKVYRQYRVKPVDVLLFLGRGVLLVVAVGLIYIAYELVDGVTIPNVILSVRGFFVLVAGFLLGRVQKTPMEHQPNTIYLARTVGTVLFLVSILLVYLG